ncbi:MAG: short-chain dehydrogenase, partial [Chloroflexota bacterium]
PGPTETGFQKRASIEDSRLIQGRRIMDATTVARTGYKALMAGKPLVVPGLSNKLIPLLARISPRGIVPEVVKRSQERVDH